MAMTPPPESLPCGVRLEELLAQVADNALPADPKHQAACPYCQTALRRLRHAWADVSDLAQEPVSVPAGLTAQIMARVKVLAAQTADFILLGHPRGETRVSNWVISRIAQRIARTVPGVVFASARIAGDSPREPDRLYISIQLVVILGPALHRLADAVRHTVQRHTLRLTGARIERIDITIDEMLIDR